MQPWPGYENLSIKPVRVLDTGFGLVFSEDPQIAPNGVHYVPDECEYCHWQVYDDLAER